MKIDPRKLIALSLTVIGVLAVAGLQNTFGDGRTAPRAKRELLIRDAYDRGLNIGARDARAGVAGANLERLARDQSAIADEKTDRGAAFREAFVRGCADGVAKVKTPAALICDDILRMCGRQ